MYIRVERAFSVFFFGLVCAEFLNWVNVLLLSLWNFACFVCVNDVGRRGLRQVWGFQKLSKDFKIKVCRVFLANSINKKRFSLE